MGSFNTATGDRALFNHATGDANTVTGAFALENHTNGDDNTAIGFAALHNLTAGSGNTAIGRSAGIGVTAADNVTCIEADGANVGNSCFIGRIFGVTTGGIGTPVLIDAANQLGTISSSKRFKREIKPMDSASEAILALKPVTFQYKSDQTNTPQFGLVAEDVAEVNPDLVVCDKNGEIYTVRYDAVNAMLLNEFLKEHRKVQELQATVLQQQKSFQSKLEAQEKQIASLASGLRKIDARFQLSTPEQQLAVKNHKTQIVCYPVSFLQWSKRTNNQPA